MAEDPLLDKARHGDREALNALCQREWQPLYARLVRTTRDRVEAQDLTQEALLRVVQSLPRFRGEAPFRAFLATVARNLLRDRWRRAAPPVVGLEHVREVAAPGATPEDGAVTATEMQRVREAFASLRDDYQTVVRLRILEGRPIDEVAVLLDRRPDAVRQLQHRAIVALRGKLQEEVDR
jgi:RNA polymerase sigma-70 factor (ECF subfamily)